MLSVSWTGFSWMPMAAGFGSEQLAMEKATGIITAPFALDKKSSGLISSLLPFLNQERNQVTIGIMFVRIPYASIHIIWKKSHQKKTTTDDGMAVVRRKQNAYRQ